jgi:hypothetical protein
MIRIHPNVSGLLARGDVHGLREALQAALEPEHAVIPPLSLPKTSSMQFMPHTGTHEALHRVGHVVVCEGWRVGREP